MAKMSPYLQLLLSKKRDPYQEFDPLQEKPNPALAAPVQEPTIAIRPRATPPPVIAPVDPVAQEPTIPIRYRAGDLPSNGDPRVMARPVGNGKYEERVVGPEGRIEGFGDQRDYAPLADTPTIPIKTIPPRVEGTPSSPWLEEGSAGAPSTNPAPTIALKPRTALEDAADTVRKYEQGLHKDPKTGEWVPHKRSKVKQVLEGLATVGASGLGINLQNVLHPKGTPEQQARRALAREVGLEDQSIQTRRAESDIARDTAVTEKLGREAQIPIESPAEKAAYEALKESLRMHPQPFDPNDPADAVLLEKAKRAGIDIPRTYGKQPKEAAKLVAGRTKRTEDGKDIYVDDNGDPVLDSQGQPIVHGVAKPDKASGETQEEADKREAEARAVKAEADSARGLAEHINKELQPLYTERGTLESQLKGAGGINWDNTDPAKGPVKDSNQLATLKESITGRLKEVREKIAEQEKLRDTNYSKATSKEAEALKYQRSPKAQTAPSVVKPAKDGKYHYTMDQIRATIGPDGRSKSGLTLDEVIREIKSHPKAVIDGQ